MLNFIVGIICIISATLSLIKTNYFWFCFTLILGIINIVMGLIRILKEG